MKKSIFSLLVALGLLFCLYSCEKQDGSNTTQKEEYIELGLVPKGVDFSITPMSSRASSSDMYCVCVVRGDREGGISGKQYATWVTNDLSTEKFKLLKGDVYHFYVMYIPNGQDILMGVGYAPFWGLPEICPGLEDGICYGTNYYCQGGQDGAARRKGDADSGLLASGYYYNDVDRYHGYVQVEAATNVTLEVNLYRQMFGLDIIANNFTEGKIRINPDATNGTANNEIILTPSNPSVSKILELTMMPWCDSGPSFTEEDVKNNESELRFAVDYIDKDGKTMTILNYNKPIKRMTKLTMTLDVAAILEDIQAGLNPNVVTGEEWVEEKFDY